MEGTSSPDRESLLAARESVQGECPEGCGKTLFLGAGGHVTCSWRGCPNPAAADEMLRNSGLLKVTEDALRERNTRLTRISDIAEGKADRLDSATPRRGGPHAPNCAYIITGGDIVCSCPTWGI